MSRGRRGRDRMVPVQLVIITANVASSNPDNLHWVRPCGVKRFESQIILESLGASKPNRMAKF
jgi:hypothetical protein